MAITTLNGLIAGAKQSPHINKTSSRTAVAANWFSVFDIAGSPGAGVLAGTSLAAGVVPTSATAGFPFLSDETGDSLLSVVEFGNTVACRLALFDVLWKGGAYAFNANQTLSGQPSFASRCPDYTGGAAWGKGNQIWVETVTAATGNQTWNVGYTNDAGVASQSTGAVGVAAAPIVGRCWRLPLAAGSSGVQKIDSVVGGTGSAGTANILVLRPLWTGRVRVANDGDVHGFDKTGLPLIYTDSALTALVNPDGTSTGLPELLLQVASG